MANTCNVLKPSSCFEIQKIIGISTIHGNCRSYQVQWAPTWISGAHLIGCEDLIEKFEEEEKAENAEICTNHSKDDTVLDDTTVIVMQNNVSTPRLQIKQEIQDEDEDEYSAFSQDYIDHENNERFVSTAWDSVNQQSIGNDDNLYSSRSLVHTDLQQTDNINVNLGANNSAETVVIAGEDTNYLQPEDIPSHNVQHYNSDIMNEEMFNNNSFEKHRERMSVDMSRNAGESSRYFNTNLWKKERNYECEQTFQCLICNKVFSNAAALQEHTGLHNRIHHCTICFKNFACKQNLQKHRFICKGNLQENSFAYSGSSDYNNADSKIRSRRRKVFQCSICFKTFACKQNLQKHEVLHFTCRICKERFPDVHQLEAHITLHKAETEDPLECGYCSKRFPHKAKLVIHERAHTGERPFECRVCQMTFKIKYKLRLHERLHME